MARPRDARRCWLVGSEAQRVRALPSPPWPPMLPRASDSSQLRTAMRARTVQNRVAFSTFLQLRGSADRHHHSPTRSPQPEARIATVFPRLEYIRPRLSRVRHSECPLAPAISHSDRRDSPSATPKPNIWSRATKNFELARATKPEPSRALDLFHYVTRPGSFFC